MGARGPVPKRSTERIRRNADAKAAKVTMAGRVTRPHAPRSWHPRARAWFRSLGDSGQAQFYEPSDWQLAAVLAELLSKYLASSRPSAELLKAWLAGIDKLGATEGSRRRMRIEIDRRPSLSAVDELPADEADDQVDAQFRRLTGGG